MQSKIGFSFPLRVTERLFALLEFMLLFEFSQLLVHGTVTGALPITSENFYDLGDFRLELVPSRSLDLRVHIYIVRTPNKSL